jgi:membrane associated rhomboid family serine protease
MDHTDLLMRSPATLALLATNILVSVAAWQNVRLIDAMLFDISLIRRRHEYHRMITSGFIHGDPFHLFMNMLALFFLAPALEATVGTWVFLGIYLASLLAGSLWTYMEHFRDAEYRALGASGAVSGVTSAAAIFYPLSTILLFFALPMPFILFAVLYIGWSAWAASTRVRDGIGHAAHLGGALMGVALVCIFWPQVVRQSWTEVVEAVRPP